jgi:hypothetical protein
MASGERQLSVRVMGAVKRKGTGESANMSADLTLDYFGESYEQKLRYADGVLYRDFSDRKLKSAMDFREALSLFHTDPLEFPEQAAKTSSVTNNDEGGQDAVIFLDTDMTRDFLMERVLTMDELTGLEDASIDFSEAKLHVRLDEKGRLKSRLLMITASVVLDGNEATLIYELELNVIGTEGVDVGPVPDPDDYINVPDIENI